MTTPVISFESLLKVRKGAYEVETVTAAGQHRYIVAIDISAAQHD